MKNTIIIYIFFLLFFLVLSEQISQPISIQSINAINPNSTSSNTTSTGSYTSGSSNPTSGSSYSMTGADSSYSGSIFGGSGSSGEDITLGCSAYQSLYSGGDSYVTVNLTNSINGNEYLNIITLYKGSPYTFGNITRNGTDVYYDGVLYYNGQTVCGYFNRTNFMLDFIYNRCKVSYECDTSCLNMSQAYTGVGSGYLKINTDCNGYRYYDYYRFTFSNPSVQPPPIHGCQPYKSSSNPFGPSINVSLNSFRRVETDYSNDEVDYDAYQFTMIPGKGYYIGDVKNYTADFLLYYDGKDLCSIYNSEFNYCSGDTENTCKYDCITVVHANYSYGKGSYDTRTDCIYSDIYFYKFIDYGYNVQYNILPSNSNILIIPIKLLILSLVVLLIL